jgi:hypothetical protein
VSAAARGRDGAMKSWRSQSTPLAAGMPRSPGIELSP